VALHFLVHLSVVNDQLGFDGKLDTTDDAFERLNGQVNWRGVELQAVLAVQRFVADVAGESLKRSMPGFDVPLQS